MGLQEPGIASNEQEIPAYIKVPLTTVQLQSDQRQATRVKPCRRQKWLIGLNCTRWAASSPQEAGVKHCSSGSTSKKLSKLTHFSRNAQHGEKQESVCFLPLHRPTCTHRGHNMNMTKTGTGTCTCSRPLASSTLFGNWACFGLGGDTATAEAKHQDSCCSIHIEKVHNNNISCYTEMP